MRYCNFEENFLREAKYAELSQAVVHCKIRNLKTAFIGSRLAVARLCVMLLPLLSLLIPALSIELKLPLNSSSYALSGLGLYQMYSDGTLMWLFGMKASQSAGEAVFALIPAAVGYAVVALVAVIVLLESILCFISYKNMQKITAVTACVGIAGAAADYVLSIKFLKGTSSCAIFSAKSGFGLIIALVMFIAVAAVNFLLWKKGIPVEYNEGALERREIYEKVRRGEISLDDLPQPVVETEETRKIDEEIAKEEANLEKIRAQRGQQAE